MDTNRPIPFQDHFNISIIMDTNRQIPFQDQFNISVMKSLSGTDVFCSGCQFDGHNIVKCESCKHESCKYKSGKS